MVYFIQYGNDGPIKIGMVCGNNKKSVGYRLASLQGGTPIRLKIIGYCQGEEKEEEMLHKNMRKYRVSGEWYALKKEEIELIKNLTPTIDEDRKLFEETISADELVREIQDEFDLNIYYKRLSRFLTTNKKIPFYKIFGRKRYKYIECKEYLIKHKLINEIRRKA